MVLDRTHLFWEKSHGYANIVVDILYIEKWMVIFKKKPPELLHMNLAVSEDYNYSH